MKGKVTLVGAGPGDPGLLTLRGAEVLQTAEVVIYDRLVGEKILNLIPAHAERIPVGKEPRLHPVPQSSINEILLQKALEGKNVVRLKGGDPFLFGRGGEELELLRQNSVPFEVVSGVSSALAAPASAGIPVTHRDWASSLHIVTGHARAGKELDINFRALKEAGGPCVFLMGMAALEGICAGLLSAGMPEETPAAVVERGTLPTQRKLVSTLSRLPEKVRQEGLSNPAVIVVGSVAALSEDYDWFIRRPLFGKRVVVPRPSGRGEGLCRCLRSLGAHVLECPTISTVSTLDSNKIQRILNLTNGVQWISFTSTAGVAYFFSALWAAGLDLRRLSHLRFAAVGPATARALGERGIRADYVPEVYDTPHLARGLAERAKGEGVLLLRSAQGSPELPSILREAGVPFEDVAIYETVTSSQSDPLLLDWLSEGEVLVTFTSGSTVRGFVEGLPVGTDLSRVRGVSIGEQTAAECRQYGISTLVAPEATEQGLIDLITSAFCERSE